MLAAGAGSLGLITYRIQTETGELVIESDDPDIDVIIKQGGKQVTIVDPKTNNRIELNTGRYELQMAGGGDGLKLSTDSFTLKRGDRTVVTVRRECLRGTAAYAGIGSSGRPKPKTLARSRGFRARTTDRTRVPPRRRPRVLYSTGGDNQNDQWLPGTDPAVWLGDLADPKNPRKFTGHGPGGFSLAVARDGHRAHGELDRQHPPDLGRRDRQVTTRRVRGDWPRLGCLLGRSAPRCVCLRRHDPPLRSENGR